MRALRSLSLFFLAALVSAVAVQADDKADDLKDTRSFKPGEVEIEEPGPVLDNGAAARKRIATCKKEYKATKESRKRAAAVKQLGGINHPEILKAAVRYLKSKDSYIAYEAAIVIARQTADKKKSAKAILAALKKERRKDVVCVLLVALGTLGNTKGFEHAMRWYRKDFGEARKAATRYFGLIRAKEAFRLLAEELDEPRPKNVNDPNNPPAEWWKQRWKYWKSNYSYVRKALERITDADPEDDTAGETFDTTGEAKRWAGTADARKLGIKW